MRVLLYCEAEKMIQKSGIGRALKHQMAALESQHIDYTCDPNDVDYDILHINTIGPNSSGMIKKARKLGKKVIYHAHSTEEDFRDSFMFSNQIAPAIKMRLISLYTKADWIITPTPYSKGLLEGYGIEIPIDAISNGINLERFNYNEAKIKAFKDYFHLGSDEKVVFGVGLYFDRKGLLDFVEVAKRLPEYTFIWFGYTPLYSIPKNIRQLITKDHPSNVLFPGYVSGPVIEGAFCGGDVFFFPSKEETEGIVVLEALASFQQVVIRDIPVFEPWMIDQVNCYKGDSVEDFVRIISHVIDHDNEPMRQAARKCAEKRSIKEIGKELRLVYEKVLKQP